MSGQCPTHPDCAAFDCPRCERLIENLEYERHGDGTEGEWQIAQERYEKWLNQIGDSA